MYSVLRFCTQVSDWLEAKFILEIDQSKVEFISEHGEGFQSLYFLTLTDISRAWRETVVTKIGIFFYKG